MKTRRFFYILIGSLLILINLLVDLVNPDKPDIDGNNNSYSIGYFIGAHIFIIIGLILLISAFQLNKKIKLLKENKEIKKAVDELGVHN